MLRLLGMVAMLGLMSNASMAKPAMVPAQGQAKELTPMEREHFAPDQIRPETTPTLPPSRSKSDESAAIGLPKFGGDFLPKLTLPLGLAQRPSWITR